MKYVAYLVAATVGLAGSYMVLLYIMFGGNQKLIYGVVSFLVFAHLSSYIFAYKKGKAGDAIVVSLALASPPFFCYFALFAFALVTSIM